VPSKVELLGNRHAQAQHDAVALKDHRKYQSLATNLSVGFRKFTLAFDKQHAGRRGPRPGAATSLRMTRTTIFGFLYLRTQYSSTYGRPITYLMGGSLVEVHSSSYFCLSHARTVFSTAPSTLVETC
jgi:hypothetical protein